MQESKRGTANFTLTAAPEMSDAVAFCGDWYSDPPDIVPVTVFMGSNF